MCHGASACSRNLLCNMFEPLTLIIGTDAMLQFLNTQLPLRFGNGPLAMHPFGLDPIEPGTLRRQSAHHHTTAAVPLDTPVVRLEPRPHGLADVPRGSIPYTTWKVMSQILDALKIHALKSRAYENDPEK